MAGSLQDLGLSPSCAHGLWEGGESPGKPFLLEACGGAEQVGTRGQGERSVDVWGGFLVHAQWAGSG